MRNARWGSVAVATNQEGYAHYTGINRCGNVWECPTCSHIIRTKKAAEIEQAVSVAESLGLGMLFVTRTIRHRAQDTLKKNLKVLAEARACFGRHRRWRAIKKKYQITYNVKALEMTIGQNGWHTHDHDLFFCAVPLTEKDVIALRAEISDLWAECVVKVGGRAVSDEHGVDVQLVDHSGKVVGKYIAKMSMEVTSAGEKDAKNGNRTPWQLLETDDAISIKLWREYVKATKGKSAVRWSKGARDFFGPGRSLTDEELVADDNDTTAEVPVKIEESVYRELIYGEDCIDTNVEILEEVERAVELSRRSGAPPDCSAVAQMLGCVGEIVQCVNSDGEPQRWLWVHRA